MEKTPESILIIGSGTFGLSTAWALTKRPRYNNTTITVVDHARGQFPPEDAASVDTSRIIRADYADADYSAFADEAQDEWRKPGDDMIGGQGRYSQGGFVVMSSEPKTAPTPGKKSGMEYAKMSFDNVRLIAQGCGKEDKITEINGRKKLQEYLGADGDVGDWGYVNKLSGWADNGASMKWMYEQAAKTGRINFVDAEVSELVNEGKKVVGAKLKDGRVLKADIVFAAAGAWTGALIDLRGRCEATGQAMGYINVTQEEEDKIAKLGVVINWETGLFVIPPKNRVLKVARHAFGYLNPTKITRALPPSHTQERAPFLASIPWTIRDDGVERFPADSDKELRWALKNMMPVKGLENRPWIKQRLCWYSDTRDADWLIDWHPEWEGLFVATGDSGHGFKFLPVIGDKLVDVLEGKGGRLAKKWVWKEVENDGQGRETTDGRYKGLVTYDGSRGGQPDCILADEFRKGGMEMKAKSKL